MKQQEKPAKNLLTRIRNLNPKNRFAAVISSSILSLALAATTCGTFAWFTYASNVFVDEYKGVSVGALNIELGYVSELEFTEADIYGASQIQKTEDGKFIYWFENGFSSEALHKLIELNGYSPDSMYPVTTGSYSATNDDFSLLRAPVTLRNYNAYTPADPTDYTHMSFVFRVNDVLEPNNYLANQEIFMCVADAKSDYDIRKSFRVHTDNLVADEGKMKHLINVDDDISEDGVDSVGGVLDLNGDGFYDTMLDTVTGQENEFYYGEFENVEGYSSGVVYYKDSPRSSDSEQVGKHTTFNAKHKAGTYEVNGSITQPLFAEYETVKKFEDETTPVAKTREYQMFDDSNNLVKENLAFLDVTVFVEGWDLYTIDPEIQGQDRPYELDIQFEVLI